MAYHHCRSCEIGKNPGGEIGQTGPLAPVEPFVPEELVRAAKAIFLAHRPLERTTRGRHRRGYFETASAGIAAGC